MQKEQRKIKVEQRKCAWQEKAKREAHIKANVSPRRNTSNLLGIGNLS